MKARRAHNNPLIQEKLRVDVSVVETLFVCKSTALFPLLNKSSIGSEDMIRACRLRTSSEIQRPPAHSSVHASVQTQYMYVL